MTVFEHSFALIGMVLGLALAQVLTELVRAVRTLSIKSLGTLTPLLAVFVILDIGTWWGILWHMREVLPNIWPVLGIGLFISCLYYIAAMCIFPENLADWADLDDYYSRNRRLILGLVYATFAMTTALDSFRSGHFVGDLVAITYFVVLGVTWLVPWKWANQIGLGALILISIWAFFPV